MPKRGPAKNTVHDLDYIQELLHRGMSLEWIAKDSGVQLDSLLRRLRRAGMIEVKP